MQEAIIFDIDGTLSDDTWRNHFIKKEKPEWDEYFSRCDTDPTIDIACDVCWGLMQIHHIIFLTGRPEKYRTKTKNWIDSNSSFNNNYTLLMRPNGNTERSVEFKRKAYLEKIKDKYDIKAVFENKKSIADMFKSYNIPVFLLINGK